MIETPKVGCDTFVQNENNEVLLIQRSDNDLWALPGGYNDLGETPKACAIRECFEETGFRVNIKSLLGIFSSLKYTHTKKSVNKRREICHILFLGQIDSGTMTLSDESKDIQWFSKDNLPLLSDGHKERIELGFKSSVGEIYEPHFE